MAAMAEHEDVSVDGYRCHECRRTFYVDSVEEVITCPMCDSPVAPLTGPFVVTSARSADRIALLERARDACQAENSRLAGAKQAAEHAHALYARSNRTILRRYGWRMLDGAEEKPHIVPHLTHPSLPGLSCDDRSAFEHHLAHLTAIKINRLPIRDAITTVINQACSHLQILLGQIPNRYADPHTIDRRKALQHADVVRVELLQNADAAILLAEPQS